MQAELILEKDKELIDIPRHAGHRGIAELMRGLKVGESFVSNAAREGMYTTAGRVGIRVSSRKQEDGTFRWWRVG